MIRSIFLGRAAGLALLGVLALPAAAQVSGPGAYQEPAGAALSRHLTALSQNPVSINALMGAGKASLEVGDPQAALTFFARAEEQAPRDGRVKMWIGSALVQLEQSAAALKFFADAVSLGVPDAELAGDRGLAHDMRGNQRNARLDYALALTRGPNDEITRRLALSLAISGQREPALELLEDQLLRQDRAAWRTRALVLALTGDTAKANEAARASMPAAQATAMAPFLARLPSLTPSERALAVHFGHMPGDGRTRVAQVDSGRLPALAPSASIEALRPDAGQTALGPLRNPPAEPVSAAARRRPGAETQATMVAAKPKEAAPRPQPVQTARADPPARIAQPTQSPASRVDDTPATARADPPVRTAAPTQALASRVAAQIQSPASRTTEPTTVPASRLADIAALVESLPAAESPTRTASPPAASQQRPRAATATTTRAAAARTPPPREASRHWVQIAGGADKRALPREFARLKAKAPAVFGSRAAWSTPLSATNRLLVGPFRTEREAQDFVNKLADANLAGFSWTSPAGQAVERLPAR